MPASCRGARVGAIEQLADGVKKMITETNEMSVERVAAREAIAARV
jgi:hypothetical protein